ncbi:MAG: LPS export ABC transporter periplasmic protein LptC [Spirochaetota bacterium]
MAAIPEKRHLGISILVPFLLFFVLSCSFDYGAVVAPRDEEQPDAIFTKFVHRIVDKGKLLLEIRAERASAYTKGHRTELEGVDFTQFNASGDVAATGRANAATVYTDSENAQFRGEVRLLSKSEDATLEAEELSWVSDRKTLSGGLERIVSVSRGDGAWVRGAGFEADLRRRSFSFQEASEGRFVPGSSSDEAAE